VLDRPDVDMGERSEPAPRVCLRSSKWHFYPLGSRTAMLCSLPQEPVHGRRTIGAAPAQRGVGELSQHRATSHSPITPPP
jgi:hypothetical protein